MRHLTAMVFVVAAICLTPFRGVRGEPIPGFDPLGARMAAMGGATAALTGSPTSGYHNPAGLAWQTISGGFGIQPTRFNQLPRSWWLSLYNKGTEYGFPLSFTAQGWRMDMPEGPRNNVSVGIPFAYKVSPYSPAAVDIKWAMEQTESGRWISGFPLDFGFLVKSERGGNIGVVLRNVAIGGNRFRILTPRTDYGIAWETGVATISMATSAENWDEAKDVRDRIRVGMEFGASPQVLFRGGYVKWEGRTWYTAGIGLNASRGGIYFDYAVIYDKTDRAFSHFLQYIYIIR